MPCGKCWVCDADIASSFFDRNMDVMSLRFCHGCWHEHTKQHKETISEYTRLKNMVMFERAMRFMEKANTDMERYKRYAKAVQKHSAESPELYKSAHEMIAAIVMLETGAEFEMNYKVGTYVADMYLPDMNLIVEIDGEVHEGKELKDSNRDVRLRQMLGEEWEIIRIPTKHIEENPARIPDAVQALAKQKRMLRKRNGGFLPGSYSKREAARYKNAMEYQNIKVPR